MRRALLLCALAAPALCAAGEADHWYVVPQVGGISPDHRRSLEDQNWLFGIRAGRELNRYLNLELDFNGARLGDRYAPGHLYTYGTSLDLLGILNRDGLVAPFASLGAGVLRNTPSPGPNQTHLLAETGLGLYLNLWRSHDQTSAFSLRPELRARWDEPGRDRHLIDYTAMLGFQLSFGGHAVRASAPPPPPP